jgi:adenylate cyclase
MRPEAFAELVGATREEVDEYRSHGLLDPDGDGLLDDLDLVRLQFVRRWLTYTDHTPDSLGAAIRDRQIDRMYGGQLFETGSLSLEDAADRVRLEPDQLRELLAALGFAWTALRESDVEAFQMLRTARDSGLPWEAVLGVTRVLGDSLRRIAEAEIRSVHVYVHERLTIDGVSQDDVEQQIFGIAENLAPLMDLTLTHLHHQYLLEANIEDAFLHLASSEISPDQLGSVETTIVFVDIASFTALTEAGGDHTAVQVLDRMDVTVRPLLVEHRGKLVKQVGDGFMLAFRDPADAVRFALATQVELARDPDLPAIRVGINTGPALYRTGDYLGGAVNVAARVVASAMAGQIVLTEPVAKAASNEGIPVEEIGVRMMRGVDDPLALYRVRAG